MSELQRNSTTRNVFVQCFTTAASMNFQRGSHHGTDNFLLESQIFQSHRIPWTSQRSLHSPIVRSPLFNVFIWLCVTSVMCRSCYGILSLLTIIFGMFMERVWDLSPPLLPFVFVVHLAGCLWGFFLLLRRYRVTKSTKDPSPLYLSNCAFFHAWSIDVPKQLTHKVFNSKTRNLEQRTLTGKPSPLQTLTSDPRHSFLCQFCSLVDMSLHLSPSFCIFFDILSCLFVFSLQFSSFEVFFVLHVFIVVICRQKDISPARPKRDILSPIFTRNRSSPNLRIFNFSILCRPFFFLLLLFFLSFFSRFFSC